MGLHTNGITSIINRGGCARKHGGQKFTLSYEVAAHAVPSTTLRQYRAGHALRRVQAHHCRIGLFSHATTIMTYLFAARQRTVYGAYALIKQEVTPCFY